MQFQKTFSERYDKYVIIEYSFKHERCLDFKVLTKAVAMFVSIFGN